MEITQLEISKLKAFAIKHLQYAGDPDDLVSEALLKAMKYKHRYKEEGHLMGWLVTILRNTAINEYRRNQVRKKYYIPPDQNVTYPRRPIKDVSLFVEAALRDMYPLHRRILILRACDFSYKEIAKRLEIEEGTVMSGLYRARKFFRNHTGWESYEEYEAC